MNDPQGDGVADESIGTDRFEPDLPSSIRPVQPESDGDQTVEAERGGLPKFSLRQIILWVTLAAGGMWTIRAAVGGNAIAQTLAMVLATLLLTFVAYAAFYAAAWFLTRPFARVMWFVAAAATLALADAWAVDPPEMVATTYPPSQYAAPFRVRFETDSTLRDGGYHRIVATFRPRGRTFASDHRCTVRIRSDRDHTADSEIIVRREVTLSTGETTKSETILIPNFGAYDRFYFEVLDGGEPMAPTAYFRTSLEVDDAVGGFVCGMSSRHPVPDVRSLRFVLGGGEIPGLPDIIRLDNRLSKQAAFVRNDMFVAAEVPIKIDHWLELTELNMMILPSAQIDAWAADGTSLDALKRWVAAGNRLWVYDASNLSVDFFENASRDRTNPVHRVRYQSDPNLMTAGGLRPRESQETMTLDNDGDIDYGKLSSAPFRRDVLKQLKDAKHPIITPPKTDGKFLTGVSRMPFGTGSIVLIDDADPFPGSHEFWSSIEAADNAMANYPSRYEHDSGSLRFWLWTIPGVGVPPLKSYLVLNTLFVLIVGPIGYVWLRRRGRLYLLYFIAPAMAVIFTAMLVLYVLVADGLSTRVRTVQYTVYDAAAQTRSTMDRLTVYSATGDAIRFPADAAVTHEVPMTFSYWNKSPRPLPRCEIDWSESSQVFSGGFAPSRRQMHYQSARVDLNAAPPVRFESVDGQIKVTNDSDRLIRKVFYHAADPATGSAAAPLVSAPIVSAPIVSAPFVSAVNVRSGETAMMTSDSDDRNTRLRWLHPDMNLKPYQELDPANFYYRNADPLAIPTRIEEVIDQTASRSSPGDFMVVLDSDSDRVPIDDAVLVDGVEIMIGLADRRTRSLDPNTPPVIGPAALYPTPSVTIETYGGPL